MVEPIKSCPSFLDIALGAKTKNKDYYADNTIICSGAWSSSLLGDDGKIFPSDAQS
jgi:glycine oxidase